LFSQLATVTSLFLTHSIVFAAIKAVEMLVQSGCESSKIILGIPAYARHTANPSLVKTHSEIIDEWSKENEMTKDQFLAISEYKGFLIES
jgi:GH18 family chitinase